MTCVSWRLGQTDHPVFVCEDGCKSVCVCGWLVTYACTRLLLLTTVLVVYWYAVDTRMYPHYSVLRSERYAV